MTVVIAGSKLHVAHVGDSRAALGSVAPATMGGGAIGARAPTLVARFLTRDHKPDLPNERSRIEAAGGSVAFLPPNGKPFIRGGDFLERHAAKEHPMQLNYSRALGGKDLVPYGLSAVPDISTISITSADRVLVVASDGLWDVCSPEFAVEHVLRSHRLGRNPSAELVQYACVVSAPLA